MISRLTGHSQLFFGLSLVALVAFAPACGGGDGAPCSIDEDCPSGELCMSESCVDPGDADVGPRGDGSMDDSAVMPPQDGGLDSGLDADADSGPAPMINLPDYITCERDADCPVGLGNCIEELTLNRPDSDGRTTVTLGEIDSRFEGLGICSLSCEGGAGACDELSIRAADGTVSSYSCQVVFTGVAPYPEAPVTLPVTVDDWDLEHGQAFAAVCRPPFGIAAEHDDAFCSPCDGDASCGTGSLCWQTELDEVGDTGAPGVCLEPCTAAADCVFGFECTELFDDSSASLGSFCSPREATCGACRDADDDGRGAGLCAAAGAEPSSYDCNDADPEIYYDADAPGHAFPGICGDFDYNCNGVSDELDQDVSAEHCGGCDTPCAGALPNGSRSCKPGGVCGVACTDPMAYFDCDGDVTNGCEVPIGDPSSLYWWDGDGDGQGTMDPTPVDSAGDLVRNPFFACSGGAVPAGYVSNTDDCDDSNAAIYTGTVDDVCDGADNDCDGSVDEDSALWLTTSCAVGGGMGACGAGTYTCSAAGALVCGAAPVATATETCADVGVDNTCNGDDPDYVANGTGALVVLGTNCAATATAAGELGICADNATWTCSGGTTATCTPGTPAADEWDNGVDENCDGVDGVAADAFYVAITGFDTNAGTFDAPYRTIKKGTDRAGAAGRSRVYVGVGTYSEATVRWPDGVDVVGGLDSDWQRAGGTSVLELSGTDLATAVGRGTLDGIVGLTCEAGSGGGTWVGIDVEVTAPAGAAAGTSVVGAWLEGCTDSWFAARVTAGNGVDGVRGDDGLVGANGGMGGFGGAGMEGDRSAGGAGGTAGPGGCRVAGAGGDGGDARTAGAPESEGSTGGYASGWSISNPSFGWGGTGGDDLGVKTGGAGYDGRLPWVRATGGARGERLTSPTNSGHIFDIATRSGGPGGLGQHGYGGGAGGGGAAGQASGGDYLRSGAGGGAGGSGGCGGAGAGAGGGGGSSVGVVVVNSNIHPSAWVTAGNGGDGGRGGRGDFGGIGGPGGINGIAISPAGSGGRGGEGTSGGGGGGGGGGAGGYSIAILVGGTSSGVGVSSSTLAAGNHGAPGSGGGVEASAFPVGNVGKASIAPASSGVLRLDL